MMECREARHLLLEADLLLDADPTQAEQHLSQHLEACADCRGLVATVRSHTRALGDVLERPNAERPDLDLILAAAAVPSVETRRSRIHVSPALTFLAAAALATVLFMSGGDRPLPGTPLVSTAEVLPDVEVAAGNVAVIQTANPDITVLWFYE